MLFKLLIEQDYEKALISARTVYSYGIKIIDERIASVHNGVNKDEIIMEVRVFVCEGSLNQLHQLCNEQNLKFRKWYEGAPLFY